MNWLKNLPLEKIGEALAGFLAFGAIDGGCACKSVAVHRLCRLLWIGVTVVACCHASDTPTF